MVKLYLLLLFPLFPWFVNESNCRLKLLILVIWFVRLISNLDTKLLILFSKVSSPIVIIGHSILLVLLGMGMLRSATGMVTTHKGGWFGLGIPVSLVTTWLLFVVILNSWIGNSVLAILSYSKAYMYNNKFVCLTAVLTRILTGVLAGMLTGVLTGVLAGM